ncbi:L,D-transpeptidase family protein [cf. Phormidesmis sp. LEGE 11477]|uniref:L,D-transpeptidase family protein n=1 Tax=cf. Phormidesmis sp. LEGE 11477 TaxID=1828680 RepID=UPI00187F40AC|nr:L,D-transpeptidase family protein [cf. Phormidesmis sp. LEGE 11477]MBE9060104.1 L,D-transpeptidase family protein [cf. Phormidesmis sp. LEGE 11477]
MSEPRKVWRDCWRANAAVLLGASALWVSTGLSVRANRASDDATALRTYAITRTEAAKARLANHRVVLDISDRKVYLYDGSELIKGYPVAVGTPETPTPTGEFAVTQLVVNPVWQSPWTGEVRSPGPNSALGLRWIGFTSNREGVFGFHGTPTVESIGHATSNGCVRMHNADVVELFAQVAIGTTVSVVP